MTKILHCCLHALRIKLSPRFLSMSELPAPVVRGRADPGTRMRCINIFLTRTSGLFCNFFLLFVTHHRSFEPPAYLIENLVVDFARGATGLNCYFLSSATVLILTVHYDA